MRKVTPANHWVFACGDGSSTINVTNCYYNDVAAGETTGVNDVRRMMEDVRGDVYDLQGRDLEWEDF